MNRVREGTKWPPGSFRIRVSSSFRQTSRAGLCRVGVRALQARHSSPGRFHRRVFKMANRKGRPISRWSVRSFPKFWAIKNPNLLDSGVREKVARATLVLVFQHTHRENPRTVRCRSSQDWVARCCLCEYIVLTSLFLIDAQMYTRIALLGQNMFEWVVLQTGRSVCGGEW